MAPIDRFLNRIRITSGRKFRLREHDPAWSAEQSGLPKSRRKEIAEKLLSDGVEDLASIQELLYASDTYSVLLIFQAMDAAGKDGTIRHVMSGVNPQGCQVFSFKHPSAEELDHHFLWRYTKSLPERGRIGIFNRSYYEEVLVVKVHPELVKAQRIPGARPEKKSFWAERYEDIRNVESHLARNGTLILKFFLHLSKDEQRRRFLERLERPEKHWKFSPSDMHERGFWDNYQKAYEECIRETSAAHAPWYVIPADHKWAARALVARAIVTAIKGLKLSYPKVSAQHKKALEAARRRLAEG